MSLFSLPTPLYGNSYLSPHSGSSLNLLIVCTGNTRVMTRVADYTFNPSTLGAEYPVLHMLLMLTPIYSNGYFSPHSEPSVKLLVVPVPVIPES